MDVLTWRDEDQGGYGHADRVMLKADSVAWPPYEDTENNIRNLIHGKPRVFRIVYSKSKLSARGMVLAFAPVLADGMKTFDTVSEAKIWCEEMELAKLNGKPLPGGRPSSPSS